MNILRLCLMVFICQLVSLPVLAGPRHILGAEVSGKVEHQGLNEVIFSLSTLSNFYGSAQPTKQQIMLFAGDDVVIEGRLSDHYLGNFSSEQKKALSSLAFDTDGCQILVRSGQIIGQTIVMVAEAKTLTSNEVLRCGLLAILSLRGAQGVGNLSNRSILSMILKDLSDG